MKNEEIPFAFLEFGEIDRNNNKKKVWDFRTGQQAYDWLMGARYFNDILGYQKMENNLNKISDKQLIKIFIDYIHHKDDISSNLGKLLALSVVNGKSFLELGSSLFGCIEGMSFCQKLLKEYEIKNLNNDLKNVDWYGIDNSFYMNDLAILSHPDHKIHVRNSIKELQVNTAVFFAKGISLLYAIRKPEELIDIIDRNKICVFDYSFSMKGRQETTVGSGKLLEYLEFAEFDTLKQNNNKEIFVNKNNSFYTKENNRVLLDMVIGETKYIKDFIQLDDTIHTGLTKKLSHDLRNAFYLDKKSDWIKLDKFMEDFI